MEESNKDLPDIFSIDLGSSSDEEEQARAPANTQPLPGSGRSSATCRRDKIASKSAPLAGAVVATTQRASATNVGSVALTTSLPIGNNTNVAVDIRPDMGLMRRTASGAPWASDIPSTASNTDPAHSSMVPNDRNLSLIQLSDEEICRYKYVVVIQDLIRFVMGTVLSWGCRDKLESDTYEEYLKKEKNLTTKALRRKFPFDEELRLIKSGKECSTFDATLLYKLIEITCTGYGLENRSLIDWKGENEDRVECLLTMVYNVHRDVRHPVSSNTTYESLLKGIEEKLRKLINVSGRIFSMHPTDVDNKVKEVTEIMSSMYDSQKAKVLFKIFLANAFKESKQYWTDLYSLESIPFSGNKRRHKDIFHPLYVYFRDIVLCGKQGKVIPYMEMLEHDPKKHNNRVIVVTGEPGSGKSTLLRNIASQFYSETNELRYQEYFDLLHYFECRNQTISDVKEFVKASFVNTFKDISMEDELDCFVYLRNLILIDGYDEINPKSAAVVNEIIQKINRMQCLVVFSSRDYEASKLMAQLEMAGVHYRAYELQEMQEEEDKTQFLKRYNQSFHASEYPGQNNVVDVFTSLPTEIKDAFVLPIQLLFFCCLSKTGHDKAKSWTSYSDFTRQIFQQYLALMEEELNHTGLPNTRYIAQELLSEVKHFALTCLVENRLALSSDDLDSITGVITQKLARQGLVQYDIDTKSILSKVFLAKSHPTSKTTYTFFHKSIHELFASRALLQELKDKEHQSLEEIVKMKLELRDKCKAAAVPERSRFLDMFKLIIVELAAPGQQHQQKEQQQQLLQRRLPELSEQLEASGAQYTDWLELTASCPHSQQLAEAAGRTAAENCSYWVLSNARQVAAAAGVLQYGQPAVLQVALPRRVAAALSRPIAPLPQPAGAAPALRQLLRAAHEHYTGDLELYLHHSYWHYSPCGRTLGGLRGAGCRLTDFIGCIGGSSDAVSAIAELLSGRQLLAISLQQPLLHHLHHLQAAAPGYALAVLTKAIQTPTSGSPLPRRPLPEGHLYPPLLVVEAAASAGDAVSTVGTLAPQGGRYWTLHLQHTTLQDGELARVLQQLAAEGVRTTDSAGAMRWEATGRSSRGDCYLCCGEAHSDGQRCIDLHLPGVADEEVVSPILTCKE